MLSTLKLSSANAFSLDKALTETTFKNIIGKSIFFPTMLFSHPEINNDTVHISLFCKSFHMDKYIILFVEDLSTFCSALSRTVARNPYTNSTLHLQFV